MEQEGVYIEKIQSSEKYDEVYDILKKALLDIEESMAGHEDLLDFVVPLTELMYITIPQLKAVNEVLEEPAA